MNVYRIKFDIRSKNEPFASCCPQSTGKAHERSLVLYWVWVFPWWFFIVIFRMNYGIIENKQAREQW